MTDKMERETLYTGLRYMRCRKLRLELRLESTMGQTGEATAQKIT